MFGKWRRTKDKATPPVARNPGSSEQAVSAPAQPGETFALAGKAALAAVEQARANGCVFDVVPRVSQWQRQHPIMRDHKIGARYGEFVANGKKAGMHEIEQLVPLLVVPEEPSAAEVWANTRGSRDAAQALLKRFPAQSWGYYMPLAPEIGTLGPVAALNVPSRMSRLRSLYRLNFIAGGLTHLCGGSLAGRSLLDMACNWGAFTIEAALRGSTDVHGFDIRAQNIERASCLGEYFGVGGDHFSNADVYEFDAGRQYDIVLNLGLMYHITKPWELVQRSYDLCKEIAVFDTVVHREPFSGFILGTGEAAATHAATAVGCELHPTYRGLIDLVYMAGFRDVIELRGTPTAEWTDFSSDPYGCGLRRCLVAFK